MAPKAKEKTTPAQPTEQLEDLPPTVQPDPEPIPSVPPSKDIVEEVPVTMEPEPKPVAQEPIAPAPVPVAAAPAYSGPVCPVCGSHSIGMAGGMSRCNQCGHTYTATPTRKPW